MKAIVKLRKEPGLELQEVEIPKPDPRDVVVEVKAAAICGSDLNCYVWNAWAEGVFVNLPFVPGHECAGVIVETGSQVLNLKTGERVAAETHIPCGRCLQCQTGRQHICQNMELFGHTVNGCFAEYFVLPEAAVRKIPESIPWEIAALMEPVGVAIRPAAEAGVFGESVLVLGCGPIGQIAMAASRCGGAASIIAADVNETRLELAKRMGADHVVHVGKDTLGAVIQETTHGDGIEHLIEASGSADALEEAFGYLVKGGKVSLLGNPKRPVQLELMRWVLHKEAQIAGFHGRRMFQTWHTAEALLNSGRLDVRPIITHRFPLQEFEEGFQRAISGEACKVLLTP